MITLYEAKNLAQFTHVIVKGISLKIKEELVMNAAISKLLTSKAFGMAMGLVACKLVEIACDKIAQRATVIPVTGDTVDAEYLDEKEESPVELVEES